MSTRMTTEEREAFLADLHVGVLSLSQEGRGPLTAPVWYLYEPGGELSFATGPSSRKGRLIAAGTRITLCAQNETPPYQYVTVEGPVTSIEPCDRDRHLRPIAIRYLGEQVGSQYADQSAEDSVLVRMRPERWLTVDYGKVG